LAGRDAGVRLAGHRRASHRVHALDRRGPDPLLDELRRVASSENPPLDGALRARRHPPFPLAQGAAMIRAAAVAVLVVLLLTGPAAATESIRVGFLPPLPALFPPPRH